MNNFEKYKSDEALKTTKFGVANGKPMHCNYIASCKDCDFYCEGCAKSRMDWLKAEYVESKENTK